MSTYIGGEVVAGLTGCTGHGPRTGCTMILLLFVLTEEKGRARPDGCIYVRIRTHTVRFK